MSILEKFTEPDKRYYVVVRAADGGVKRVVEARLVRVLKTQIEVEILTTKVLRKFQPYGVSMIQYPRRTTGRDWVSPSNDTLIQEGDPTLQGLFLEAERNRALTVLRNTCRQFLESPSRSSAQAVQKNIDPYLRSLREDQ